MKQTLLSFLMVLLPIVASADAVEIDGICYNLITKIKQAEVTRNSNNYSGDIQIPDTITYEDVKYCVTSIGGSAFFNCYELTSVIIPNTVTSIKGYAFYGCSGLKSLTFPSSLVSIEYRAFEKCENLTSVVISNGLTSIGENAFLGCLGLTAVHIFDLSAWCNITFANHNSNPLLYAKHLFLNNVEIEDLVIPNDIVTIRNSSFVGFSSMRSLTIPNSVKFIGEFAFSNCTNITSAVIPNSVISIGMNAFGYCTGLTSVTLSNSLTSIGDHVFEGCSNLVSLFIPNSVRSIGECTFRDCTSLPNIVIPNSITSIGYSAFWGCSGLSSVTIPNQTKNIGDYAFMDCNSLTSVTIGSGIKTIGKQAFSYCNELTDVFCYSETVPATENNAFLSSYIEYATLHVPESAIETYRNTAPWSDFKSVVSITDTNNYYEMAVNVNNAHGTVVFGEYCLTGGTQNYNVKEGTDVALTLTAEEGYKLALVTVDGVDKTADVVDGVLTISKVTADLTVNVTFITAGETVTAAIGAAGMATFCSTSDLDFSEVNGLTAYTGAGFNRETGVLTMLKVMDAPARTGLVLMGSEGTYEVPVKTSASVYANLLVGVTEETTLLQTDCGYVNYILDNGSHGTGFYIVSGEGQLAACKAYLRLPAAVAGESRAIGLSFTDGTTGVDGLENDSRTTTDEWRDLQGRRIVQPTKAGIYLKDGRKIVVR